jgi:hypothetical protein
MITLGLILLIIAAVLTVVHMAVPAAQPRFLLAVALLLVIVAVAVGVKPVV